MSSRTPRKVAVSIDVASFEREASLSSWRIGAAALRGKVNKDVDFGTGASVRQRIFAAGSADVLSRLSKVQSLPQFLSLSAFALSQSQSLMSEAK